VPAVEEAVRQVVAAPDRAAQLRAMSALARAAAGQLASAFQLLHQSGSDGPRLALDFAARLPDPLPAGLIQAMHALLAGRAVPVPVRLSAAARLLAAVPDDAGAVTPVVQAVTEGLSRSRALERMIQLQCRVEKCQALDELIATAEREVQLRCPKCTVRLPRRELTAHLWQRHRLVFEKGEARDPRPLLDAAVTMAVGAADPAAIDRTFLLTRHYYPDATPRQVLQALAARGGVGTEHLLERAAEDDAGLCPVCLAAVADPVPPLPPPAVLSEGRFVADGYTVDVEDAPTGRFVTFATPHDEPTRDPDTGRRRHPRTLAVLVALPLFVLAVLGTLVVPARLANPVWLAVWLALVGWLAYLAVRLSRKPLPDRTDRAADIIWVEAVPTVGRTPAAVRFLTRVCRASIGVGDPVERAATLFELSQHAAVLAPKSAGYLQLLAAVRVLEVFDIARLGRDKVLALLGVMEPFLRGELSPAYAEAVAEIVLEDGVLAPGDAERLGVLVLGAAFESELQPADLATIGRFCPWFRQLILGAQPTHLTQLAAVWRGRHSQPWSAVGDAVSVFELARESPAAARRLLADFPDLLLRIEASGATNDPVLLTVEGVRSFSGRTPARSANWLRYRTEKLLPVAESLGQKSSGKRVAEMLAPLAVTCPLCGAQSVLRTGRIGTPWGALAAGAK
jgi:predicted RNA-binding Zn-ribbon protein involved in translation (DUF1610 family)